MITDDDRLLRNGKDMKNPAELNVLPDLLYFFVYDNFLILIIVCAVVFFILVCYN